MRGEISCRATGSSKIESHGGHPAGEAIVRFGGASLAKLSRLSTQSPEQRPSYGLPLPRNNDVISRTLTG